MFWRGATGDARGACAAGRAAGAGSWVNLDGQEEEHLQIEESEEKPIAPGQVLPGRAALARAAFGRAALARAALARAVGKRCQAAADTPAALLQGPKSGS